MNTEIKSIAEIQQPAKQLQMAGRTLRPFDSVDDFKIAFRMAEGLASTTLVPKRYKGSVYDCLLGIDMAARLHCNPLMVLQNLNMINGSPSWSGSFIVATINQSGRFADPLHFEMIGEEGTDSWGCYAETITKAGRVIKGPKVTIAMAKAEGWYGKTGSKWQTMPGLMLRYRAGAFFGKTECPELLMGMPSQDEMRDIIDINPATGEVLTPITPAQAGGASVVQPEQPRAKEEDFNLPDANQDTYDNELKDHDYYETPGDDGPVFTNKHGEVWNPNVHGTCTKTKGPIMKKDGHFQLRRGGPATDAQDEAPQVGAGSSAIELPECKGQESAEENTTQDPVVSASAGKPQTQEGEGQQAASEPIGGCEWVLD